VLRNHKAKKDKKIFIISRCNVKAMKNALINVGCKNGTENKLFLARHRINQQALFVVI